MKRILICCLILCLSATVSAEEVLKGMFVEFSFGDYAHLNVMNETGGTESFWLSKDPSWAKFVEVYMETPSLYNGKDVKVYWHEVERNIPEAGGTMKLKEAIRMEFL